MFSLSPLGAAASAKPKSMLSGLRTWVAYRDTVADLRKLSPKELKDIGVETAAEDYAWQIAQQPSR